MHIYQFITKAPIQEETRGNEAQGQTGACTELPCPPRGTLPPHPPAPPRAHPPNPLVEEFLESSACSPLPSLQLGGRG